MTPAPVPTGEAVDLERDRLKGVVSLVFENRHYSPNCACEHCKATRENLAAEDLDFVNHLAGVLNGTVSEVDV